MISRIRSTGTRKWVSVPYRGATFLNMEPDWVVKPPLASIVSVPYRGATFLNTMRNLTMEEKIEFVPSPIGELHFSMISRIRSTGTRKWVSVPYRGATFLNMEPDWVVKPPLASIVSVPYRGATFLNSVAYPLAVQVHVPSPIGELHFSILYYKWIERLIKNVPSPIGELHFSISYKRGGANKGRTFRPLSGSYISQFYP